MKKAVAVLVGTVAGLLLCELAVRLLSDRLLSLSHPAVRFDPALGWVQRAGETGIRRNEAGREVAIVGSPLGIRQPPRPYERAGRHTVLVLGDSFTAGTQLPFDETWTAQLEARLRPTIPNVQVINAGVDRYDLCQQYRMAERLVARFAPRRVIATVYLGNDLADYDRTAGARPPWSRGRAGWIEDHSYLFHFARGALARRRSGGSEEPSAVEGWSPRSVPGFGELRPDQQARLRGQFAAGDVLPVWRGGEEAERRLAAAERVLEALVERVRPALVTVVLLPMKQEVVPEQRVEMMALHRLSDDDLERPRRRLLAWAVRHGVAAVDVAPALRAHTPASELFWPVDSHMTPQGHALVAQVVAPSAR